MEKLLLTAAEAAELLGVSRTKVYELMYAGLLPSVKLGALRRVPTSGLAEMVDRLSRDTP